MSLPGSVAGSPPGREEGARLSYVLVTAARNEEATGERLGSTTGRR